MSGFGSHYNTHDGYPLFYGRPMDDLDDDECQRSIYCILLTAGGLFFEFFTTPLAWLGLRSKHPHQPETQPSAFDTERMGREPYAKRTRVQSCIHTHFSVPITKPAYHTAPTQAPQPWHHYSPSRSPPINISITSTAPTAAERLYPTANVSGHKRKCWDERDLAEATETATRVKKHCHAVKPVQPMLKSKLRSTPRPRRKASRCRLGARNKGSMWVCAHTFVTTQLALHLASNPITTNIVLNLSQACQPTASNTAASGALRLLPTEDMEDTIFTGPAVEISPYLEPTSQQNQQFQYQQQCPFHHQLHQQQQQYRQQQQQDQYQHQQQYWPSPQQHQPGWTPPSFSSPSPTSSGWSPVLGPWQLFLPPANTRAGMAQQPQTLPQMLMTPAQGFYGAGFSSS
ncbi:hypothetical protein CPB97_000945 [Podila verticillata]|nr:hypothetical protein CPB97_000945 [Podila verticillata]